jgi:O-antigen/teichoic acid export membrane protein
MTESQRILKNVLAGGFGTVLGGMLQVAAVLLLARKLGAVEFGTYSILATMAFLLNRLAELGTSAIIVRDLAIEPANTRKLLSSALSLAWLLVFGISTGIAGCIHFIPVFFRFQLTATLMALSGLLQLPIACYAAVMRAYEENELEVMGFLLHKAALLLLLAAVLGLREIGVQGVATVYVACSILQFCFCRSVVRRRYARPRWRINLSEWKYLLTESAPFGLAAAIRLVGEQGDLTILACIASMSAVGLYSAVYRITIGFRFVPQAMVIGLFPAYSRAASRFSGSGSEREEFQRIYEFGIRAFTLVTVPFAITVFLASEPLTTILLGPGYQSAAPALRILGVAAGIFFVASPFPYLLTALNEQRLLLVSSACTTILRIMLVLMLSWGFGIVGTAWAVLISEATLLCIWVVYLAGKQFTLRARMMLSGPIAGIAMTPLVYFRHRNALAPLLAGLALSVGLYSIMIFKLRPFSQEELRRAAEGLKFLKPFIAEWSRPAALACKTRAPAQD